MCRGEPGLERGCEGWQAAVLREVLGGAAGGATQVCTSAGLVRLNLQAAEKTRAPTTPEIATAGGTDLAPPRPPPPAPVAPPTLRRSRSRAAVAPCRRQLLQLGAPGARQELCLGWQEGLQAGWWTSGGRVARNRLGHTIETVGRQGQPAKLPGTGVRQRLALGGRPVPLSPCLVRWTYTATLTEATCKPLRAAQQGLFAALCSAVTGAAQSVAERRQNALRAPTGRHGASGRQWRPQHGAERSSPRRGRRPAPVLFRQQPLETAWRLAAAVSAGRANDRPCRV